MGPPWETISSRKRLAWRALRETSLMPFLWSSSSSSTTIGRNTSCSSKRKRLVGSCISTFVSSTKSLVAAARAARTGPSRSRLRCIGASCEAGSFDSSAIGCEDSLRGSVGIRWASRGVGRVLDGDRSRFDGGCALSPKGGSHVVEHFLRVAGDLDPAPLARDAPVAIDHEGAALHAAHLL